MEIFIFVLDILTGVIISGPPTLIAGIAVTFTARVELRYGTTYFTPVTYQWSFSDGRNSGPIHTFNEGGSYEVNCTAISYSKSVTNSTTVNVTDGMIVCSE